MKKLEGQTAIVTGAGRGIGRAIAITLADAGANVVVTARTVSEIEEVARKIIDLGQQSIPIRVDVLDEEQINTMIEKVIQEFGKIDILINNAGGGTLAPVLKTKTKDWDNGAPDDYLDKLIKNLESDGFQEKEEAKISMQSGGYRCSTEELDELIDIAEKVKGVTGACLTGAGLGGCILVLVRKENVEGLLKNMKEKYYQPRGLPLASEVCISTEGAGVLV